MQSQPYKQSLQASLAKRADLSIVSLHLLQLVLGFLSLCLRSAHFCPHLLLSQERCCLGCLKLRLQ